MRAAGAGGKQPGNHRQRHKKEGARPLPHSPSPCPRARAPPYSQCNGPGMVMAYIAAGDAAGLDAWE